MTKYEYFKSITENSFVLDDYRIDGNTVKANIVLATTDCATVEEFLSKNNFFSIPDFYELGIVCDKDTIKLEISFIMCCSYSTYNMEICDVVDCRLGGGGLVLVSIENKYIFGEDFSKQKDTPKEEPKKSDEGEDWPSHGLFNTFGFNWDGLTESFNSFAKTVAGIFDHIDGVRNNGGLYRSVSYSIDGDGNGHWRKVDNDKVEEKFFRRVGDSIKEVEAPKGKQIPIEGDDGDDQCDGGCQCKSRKVELKDII